MAIQQGVNERFCPLQSAAILALDAKQQRRGRVAPAEMPVQKHGRVDVSDEIDSVSPLR